MKNSKSKHDHLVAIASTGPTLTSNVDPRFGRCPYFLIVNHNTLTFSVLENTAGQAFQGAGISAAQMIANKKVKAVIAGNFGPKALSVLNASGIKVLAGVYNLTAKEALEKYKIGELKPIDFNSAGAAFGPRMGCGRGAGWKSRR